MTSTQSCIQQVNDKHLNNEVVKCSEIKMGGALIAVANISENRFLNSLLPPPKYPCGYTYDKRRESLWLLVLCSYVDNGFVLWMLGINPGLYIR